MNNVIFKSDRFFKVSDFVVSHGQLLLRSNKSEERNTNIDIIFFDTTYMQISASLYGVIIRIADNKEVINYESLTTFLKYEKNHLFEIETEKKENFYIGASFVRVFENELDFSETSLGVLSYLGREKEIASSL